MEQERKMVKLAEGFYMPEEQLKRELQKAEDDVAAGRIMPFKEAVKMLSERYGGEVSR